MGGGKLPRSNNMTSFTSELYGMLGTLTSFLLVCKHYKIKENKNIELTVTTDNKESVKKTNNKVNPVSISETLSPKYNLCKLIESIKGMLPIQVRVKWVQSHQEYEDQKGRRIHGPFSRTVELNIEMDRLANEFRTNANISTIKRRTYSHTQVSIYDSDGCMINDKKKYLNNTVKGDKMKQYIKKKYNWNNIEQSLIH